MRAYSQASNLIPILLQNLFDLLQSLLYIEYGESLVGLNLLLLLQLQQNHLLSPRHELVCWIP